MKERAGETEDRLKEYGKVGLTYSRACRRMLPSFDRPAVKRSRFSSTFFQGHLIIPRL